MSTKLEIDTTRTLNVPLLTFINPAAKPSPHFVKNMVYHLQLLHAGSNNIQLLKRMMVKF